MKRAMKYVAALFVMAFMVGGVAGATIPEPAAAQGATSSCGGGFFLSAWYEGLTTPSCELKSPSDVDGGLRTYILTIGLNVVTIALQIVGYAAIFYIIYGGFRFMTSSGAPEQRSAAMKTILNAIIGLIIAIASVAIVRLLASILTGGTTNNVGIYVGLGGDTVLSRILNIAYMIAGSVAVIMGVLSGFNFVTSSGDPQKAAKARNGLLYAAIGLVIVALAAAITSFIQGRF